MPCDMRSPARCAALLLTASLFACPPKVEPGPPPLARCELDLSDATLFAQTGTGARATKIERDEDGIGGQFAASRAGDFLLENEHLRVAVNGPGRVMSHVPFGGTLIDADLKRAAGEPGRDQLGPIGLVYNFGRSVDVKRVEVLRDGSDGGPAVLAATGTDAVDDFVSVQQQIDRLGLGLTLAINPGAPVPLRSTTYYVLSPGEDRVRIVTAACNDGDRPLQTTWADVTSGGGSMDFFNPGQCQGTLGEEDCLVDPSPRFAWQGDGVAYGFRSYQFDAPSTPAVGAMVYLTKSAARVSGMGGLSDVLTWADQEARERPGRLLIPAQGSKTYVRDLVVARSLADVEARFLALDQVATGTVRVTVTEGGQPMPDARVVLLDAATNRLVSLAPVDAQGQATLTAPPGAYRAQAAVLGRAVLPPTEVTLTAGQQTPLPLNVGPARTLSVFVKDPFGRPLSAKVQVRCPGQCASKWSAYARFWEIEPQSDELAAIAYVPVSGQARLAVPPGEYQVVVTRGPEFNAWPDTFPNGRGVDLRDQDASLEATLARVVDSTGWLSADLHVHAVNSADSSPTNEHRVASFLAEGVDTIVSTDHDFVTDFRPVIAALGATEQLGNVVGSEISPGWGHHNAFPLVRDTSFVGGAIDWAGGLEGATYRPSQLHAHVRERFPDAVLQLNHPRGNQGLFTNIKLDTLTDATHLNPLLEAMEPAPGATLDDTKLFSHDWDALELQNGFNLSTPTLNDWFVFLSRGLKKTGTSVSDSHSAFASPAGYGRTFIRVANDAITALDATELARALTQGHASGTNGPFLVVTAQKLDAAGAPVGAVHDVGDTVSIAAGEKVRIAVEVQAPEWMQFDQLELHAHGTGRESVNGVGNNKAPIPVQTFGLDPKALPLEPVPGLNGFEARRVKVRHAFDVQPTADAWFVVLVRGGAPSRDLAPLVFRGACNSSTKACSSVSAKALAFSNPVYVDADGSGAYDRFALQQGLQRASPAQPSPPTPARRMRISVPEAEAALRAALRHEHE